MTAAHQAQAKPRAGIRFLPTERAVQKLEHIPVDAYHLLRRLAEAPVTIASLHGMRDEAIIGYLVSRKLAQLGPRGTSLRITPDGESIGEITDERPGRD